MYTYFYVSIRLPYEFSSLGQDIKMRKCLLGNLDCVDRYVRPISETLYLFFQEIKCMQWHIEHELSSLHIRQLQKRCDIFWVCND